MAYLNHSDMKALSETCSWMLDLTRGCHKYINTTKLNISLRDPKNIIDLSSLRSSYASWKTIRVEVDGWRESQLKIISTIIRNSAVEALELCESPDATTNILGFHELAQRFILPASGLKTLSFDVRFLVRASIPLSKEVKSQLSSLESLTILREQDWFNRNTLTEDEDSILFENRSALSTLASMPLRLKTFRYLERNSTYQLLRDPIIQLLKNNCSTLEHLTITSDILGSDSIEGILCTNLKTLELASRFLPTMCRSLKSDGTRLDKLTFGLIDEMGNATNCQQYHVKNTDTTRQYFRLDSIYVNFRPDDSSDETIEGGWYWTCHPGWKSLERLHIDQTDHDRLNLCRNSIGEILSRVPESIRSLTLSGLIEDDDWNGVEPSEGIVLCLAELPNLTKLNFLKSENSISDYVLQYICSNMTQLLELEFSHCDEVTDFGLTGIHETENTGISLKNLKGNLFIKYYYYYLLL